MPHAQVKLTASGYRVPVSSSKAHTSSLRSDFRLANRPCSSDRVRVSLGVEDASKETTLSRQNGRSKSHPLTGFEISLERGVKYRPERAFRII